MPLPRICFLIHLKTTWSWAFFFGFFFFFFFGLLLLCIEASLINNKLAIKSKPYVLNFHLLSCSITLLFRTTIIRIVVSLSLSVSQILGFNTALLQRPNLSLRSAGILDSQKGWFCSWWRCFLLTPADEHSGEGRDLMWESRVTRLEPTRRSSVHREADHQCVFPKGAANKCCWNCMGIIGGCFSLMCPEHQHF